MTLSMHAAAAPVLVRQLTALAGVLRKGAAHAEAQAIDPAVLLEARLAPDMFALTRQVQIASDMAKSGIARLAGITAPSYPDAETSFAELDARIARTIAFVESVPAEQVDGSEAREIVITLPNRELRMAGQAYLFDFVLPNLLFHTSTAYGILRARGVMLTKQDFLGGV